MTRPDICAVALCPHPPLLLPEIAAGAAPELEPLRAACDEAVGRLLAAKPDTVVVIGADGSRRGLRGFAPGVDSLAASELPPSLAIGDWLLDRNNAKTGRRWVAVAADATVRPELPDESSRIGLLVMGDGSARRSVKGPGYLDDRAAAFDDAIIAAFAAADVGALAELDARLGAELLVGGIGAWKTLAAIVGTDFEWRGELLFAAAPYGVTYAVASWLPA